MKTSTLIIAAAVGAGALWLFQRTIDRGLSGGGQGSSPPRNDATGPRLPAMPIPPAQVASGAAPNSPQVSMPAFPSMPEWGMPMMETGGSGWRAINDLNRPETNGFVNRTGQRNSPNSDDVSRVFAAWARVQ